MALDGSESEALPVLEDVVPPDVLPLAVPPPATLKVVLTTGHAPFVVHAL